VHTKIVDSIVSITLIQTYVNNHDTASIEGMVRIPNDDAIYTGNVKFTIGEKVV
jgi:hypothetical protein